MSSEYAPIKKKDRVLKGIAYNKNPAIEDEKQLNTLMKLRNEMPADFEIQRPLMGGHIWLGEKDSWQATKEMDNDDSQRKEGVKPTYKRVKGFHQLQLSWNNYIIDAIFRGGSVHGNHGDAVLKMVRHIVNLIREEYNADVAIMIRCDSAFFDESLFRDWDKLGIGFICAGKMYRDLKEDLSYVHKEDFALYETETQSWEYIEFFNGRASWDKSYRVIYYRPLYEGRQQWLEFASRTDCSIPI